MTNNENFSGAEFGNKAEGFDQPTQLPCDETQRSKWQAANRSWWETTPMRYDWRDDIREPPGTEKYFSEVDARFLSSVRKYMPWRKLPFEALIPFDSLAQMDVLEIGVGQGTHAQLLAQRCRSFTGIDLTTAASEMTAKRFQLSQIPGVVLQMDAEDMTFADSSFDYIWSWGVIHHSANTRRILEEIHRVLRPGGTSTIMVYHRSWWHFYFGGLLRRTFKRRLSSRRSLHAIAQGATDGAIARYYTPTEWRALTSDLLSVTRTRIYGLKIELLPIPAGKLKDLIEDLLPDSVGRFFTNQLHLGSFLVVDMRKAS